jgi:uncharacterized protein YdaU (DUF1376 family)
MANKPPAFQFYVKDWLSSSTVRSMSLAARGAYIDLLAFAWQSQPFATLPNDPAQLRRLVGADSAEWADIWPQISECFEVEDGHLVNRRLQDEGRKREEFIKKQQANGAKGGRPSKNLGLCSGFPKSEANIEARESFAVSSIQSSTDTGTATVTGEQEDSTRGEQEDNSKPIQSTDTGTVLIGDWADQLKMDETEQRKFAAVMHWKETLSNYWKGKLLFSLKAYCKVEEQYDKFYAKVPAGKKPHELPVQEKSTVETPVDEAATRWLQIEDDDPTTPAPPTPKAIYITHATPRTACSWGPQPAPAKEPQPENGYHRFWHGRCQACLMYWTPWERKGKPECEKHQAASSAAAASAESCQDFDEVVAPKSRAFEIDED